MRLSTLTLSQSPRTQTAPGATGPSRRRAFAATASARAALGGSRQAAGASASASRGAKSAASPGRPATRFTNCALGATEPPTSSRSAGGWSKTTTSPRSGSAMRRSPTLSTSRTSFFASAGAMLSLGMT